MAHLDTVSIDSGYVHLEVENHIGTITFFHPAHNSLPSNLLLELVRTLQLAGDDPTIRVVVLKSAGEKTFCAGASFDELSEIQDFETGKLFFMGFANLINTIRKCPKIVLGRVQGKAIGGGVGIAAATDYCFATDQADIKLSELTIGIGPFVIHPAVERKIGLVSMTQLCLEAQTWQSAFWAKDKGLFLKVLPNITDMDSAVQVLAGQLATYSTDALYELKQVLWHGTSDWDILLEERAAISGRLVLSDFTKLAIANFKQKR